MLLPALFQFSFSTWRVRHEALRETKREAKSEIGPRTLSAADCSARLGSERSRIQYPRYSLRGDPPGRIYRRAAESRPFACDWRAVKNMHDAERENIFTLRERERERERERRMFAPDQACNACPIIASSSTQRKLLFRSIGEERETVRLI